MKKLFTAIAALALCLLLAACGEEIKKDGSSSMILAGKAEDESKADNGESSDNSAAFDDSAMLNEKLALYNTSAYHADAVVPHRYLITGEESVCLATFFEVTETAVEIKRAAISSVESRAVGDLTVIKITDNSGKTVSFNADAEEAPAILSELK